MISVRRTCTKCGAEVLEDAPQGSCSACLLETGLGLLADDGAAPQVGTSLLAEFGDYELLEEIGRGGQGVVYRARQRSLNRTVALKVIGLGHWATTPHLKRFRQEAEAAASLDHPRIIPIYEIGERDGSCYFSMKLVEGGQLDAAVRRETMPLRQAAELVVKLARTVQYAHEHGILHRDIKPGNILLDEKGEPHLTDFGLARLVENESTITNSFDVLGTPSYMAPEQAAGQTKTLTAATDIYALGAVLYQMLTGQPPFAGGTTYETIRMVLETEPRRPRLWNSKIDRDLETICLKCLEKEPAKRYASAELLAEDLEHWLRHEPVRARRSGVVSRSRKWVRRNPATAVLAPVALAFAAAAAIMLWKQNSEGPPPAGIAVLPFENLSDDKDGALLADGIQDDILTKLAKIADLKVISRTSVMEYRGERNVRKISNALRVSHVLEGSLRRNGQRLHLNAQLIDTRNDQHVWAEQYDVDLADVFAIQSEIAQKIASQFKSRVSTAERKEIGTAPTQDVEAYKLYLEAKTLAAYVPTDNSAAFEKTIRAAELLEKAVARDPNFALAYCLLTETNLTLYFIPSRADLDRRARAESALEAAKRLAPDAGETHLAQARFYHYGNRDYDHALEELDIAARLLPNSADVFYFSALIERRLARWGDALRHFSKANELNPRDRQAMTAAIVTQKLLRHYAEVDRMADRAIAAFPEAADQFWKEKGVAALNRGEVEGGRAAAKHVSSDFQELHYYVLYYEHNFAEAERLSLSVWQGKDMDYARYFAIMSAWAARAAGGTDRARSYFLAARKAFEPLLLFEKPDAANLSYAGIIDAGLGRSEDAIRECRRAVELRPISQDALEGPEYAKNLALAYAWAGDRDRAIEQLSAIARVPAGVTFGELKFDPLWDSLRDDPRFQKILEQAAKPLSL